MLITGLRSWVTGTKHSSDANGIKVAIDNPLPGTQAHGRSYDIWMIRGRPQAGQVRLSLQQRPAKSMGVTDQRGRAKNHDG